MAKDKLKLDCTGCGASLFQTENPQVYKCEKCDTSFKIKFDSDGINLVVIEKKIRSLIEDVISFKEKIKKNELKLNCLICGLHINQTSIIEVYECMECKVYYKPILDGGEIKLDKPDNKTIKLLDLEREQDNLDEINRRLYIEIREREKFKTGGWVFIGIGILGISLLVFVIISEINFIVFAPFFVILSVALVMMLPHYKALNKKSKLINNLKQEKTDLEYEIERITEINTDTENN